MTKKQFIDAVKAIPYVNKVSAPKLQYENEFGDKVYLLNLRKIDGNKINYENIHAVLVDEGLPTEAAYFLKTDSLGFLNIQEHFDEDTAIKTVT